MGFHGRKGLYSFLCGDVLQIDYIQLTMITPPSYFPFIITFHFYSEFLGNISSPSLYVPIPHCLL